MRLLPLVYCPRFTVFSLSLSLSTYLSISQEATKAHFADFITEDIDAYIARKRLGPKEKASFILKEQIEREKR